MNDIFYRKVYFSANILQHLLFNIKLSCTTFTIIYDYVSYACQLLIVILYIMFGNGN